MGNRFSFYTPCKNADITDSWLLLDSDEPVKNPETEVYSHQEISQDWVLLDAEDKDPCPNIPTTIPPRDLQVEKPKEKSLKSRVSEMSVKWKITIKEALDLIQTVEGTQDGNSHNQVGPRIIG